MNLKKIIRFFIDSQKQRKNKFHINDDSSYQIMRILYRISNGLFLNLLGNFITKTKYRKFKAGYKNLENISDDKILQISEEINKMRVYNKTQIKEIHTSDIVLDINGYTSKVDLKNKNTATRMDVLKSDLFSNSKITELASQKKWINLIKENYGFEPQLMDITAWYTFPETSKLLDNSNEEDTSYDAQLWHQDVDKIRDIKIFIYLTDVLDLNDGPFEILKETHLFNFYKFKYFNKNNFRILSKDIPKKLEEKKLSFLGKKGTNFIVDTRCIHRGLKVKKNYRLVLELYFSNSFFGKHFKFNDFTRPKLKPEWNSYNTWKNIIKNEPDTYKYLFLGKD